MKQSGLQNVFFDLDGTLTDSREGIVKCIHYTLEKLGLPVPTEDELSRWIGPPLQDTFARKMGSTEKEDIDRAMSFYRERYTKIGIYENRIYESIPELLSRLADVDLSLYVVTSKPRVYALEVVEDIGLSSFFKAVYGSELDGKRGNKADLIRYVLGQEKLSPETAIMIGDREHDIRGAKANQVAGIGVSWGYGSTKELEDAGAIGICPAPEKLPAMLL